MEKKVLFVFGTRPEAIKMAPLILKLKNNSFSVKVCVTGQHREMLDQILNFFKIIPDYDLNIMKQNQSLNSITANVLLGLKSILEEYNPDYLIVHGDTTTTLSASIAGFYNKTKIIHIEAGLRTNKKFAPFPEEINRSLTSKLADFHFAPTLTAKKNLIKENIDQSNIFITGNTVIDALFYTIKSIDEKSNNEINKILKLINPKKKILLVTGHRRENFGKGFLEICNAIKDISLEFPKELEIIYPVHLNPNVSNPVNEKLSKLSNVHLIRPLNYEAFIWLMNKSHIILTDSGGVQEEAPSLGKPVLVMREVSERPEAIKAGTVKLVGSNRGKIFSEVKNLLKNKKYYERMSSKHNPYGDGLASERIFNILKDLSL